MTGTKKMPPPMTLEMTIAAASSGPRRRSRDDVTWSRAGACDRVLAQPDPLRGSVLCEDIDLGVHETGDDVGIVNGQNKLVPSITVKLSNVSDQKLKVLQVNALFRRVTEPDEWGSGFLNVKSADGSDGLAPGASTDPLTIRSALGYTGAEQSRQEMLRNSHFVDAKVDLFARSQDPRNGSGWATTNHAPALDQVTSSLDRRLGRSMPQQSSSRMSSAAASSSFPFWLRSSCRIHGVCCWSGS